jgi:glucokinase
MTALALGIDLGGTRIKGIAVDADGACRAQAGAPTRDGQRNGDRPAFAAGVAEVVADLEAQVGETVPAIGLSAPGLAAADGRAVAFMRGRLDGLEGLDWQTVLNREHRVHVLNDAHAALLGERWQGAARGYTNVFLLTLGTGVGGAAFCDGRLLRGHIGRAGHLGHISLDPDGPPDITRTPGSLEDAVGEATLPARSNGRFQSTAELATAVRAGDAFARTVWERSLHHLAAGVASLINVLDPEAVILGGGIAQAGDLLRTELEQGLAEMEWRPAGHQVTLRFAELGEQAGAYGAAWQALQERSGTLPQA